MTHEELTILNYLKDGTETYFARKEIARRAVKRVVYEENPHWADAPLASLLGQGLLEISDSGSYRIKKGARI